MKKTLFKISVATLVIVMLMTTFASCSSTASGKIAELVKVYKMPDTSNQKIVKLDYIKGDIIDQSNVLCITETTDRYYVYDIFREVEVFSINSISQPEIGFIGYNTDVFYVKTNEKLSIYNRSGDLIDESVTDHVVPICSNSAFTFNGNNYYISNDEILTISPGLYNNINDCEYFGGYFYHKSGTKINIYSKKGELTASYVATYDSCSVAILNNGNVLVQESHQVPNDEDDYDYYTIVFDIVKKFRLSTILIDAKNGNISDKDIDFTFQYGVGVDLYDNPYEEFNFYKTFNADNIFMITRIVDKRLLDSGGVEIALVSNNLTSVKLFSSLKADASMITQISNTRFLLESPSGNLLFDKSSKQIGMIDGNLDITANFVVYNNIIQSTYDMSTVINYAAEGYTYYDVLGDNVLLTKVYNGVNTVYLYYKNSAAEFEARQIGAESDFETCYNGYILYADGQYTYYDELCNELIKTDEKIVWLSEFNVNGVFYAYAKDYKLSYIIYK